MKKILIVSLFLLSMIGLFAQTGTPYLLEMTLQTAAGEVHAAGTVGFKIVNYNQFQGEQWDGTVMYYNWPGQEDQNTNNTIYSPTTGQIGIQMAPMSDWGGFGGMAMVRVWFIDSETPANEIGPIELAKTNALGGQIEEDPVIWGGPAPIPGPDAWATVVAPVDGSGDADSDVLLEWSYAGTVAVAGYEVTYQNVSAGTDPVSVDVTDATEYQLNDLMMDQYTYEWSAKPFVLDGETKVYPALETEMPVWSFTTAATPPTPPDNAINFFPADDATGVALDVVLTWEYSAESPAVDGFEIVFNNESQADVAANVFEFTPMELAYETTYTWSVTPFINEVAGAKSYLPSVRRTAVTRSATTRKTRDSHLTPDVTLEPLTFTTMANQTPNQVTNVSPAHEAVDVALDAQLVWSYEGTVTPTGYMLTWNGGEAMDLGNVMTYTPEGLNYNTEYTWSVTPYVDDAAKGMKAVRTYITPEDEAAVWSFTTVNTYTEDTPVEVGDASVTLEIVFTNPIAPGFTINDPSPIMAPGMALPDNAGAFLHGFGINQDVAGTFTYTFNFGTTFLGVAYLDGVQQSAGSFENGVVTVTITFTGAKEAHEVVITEPTLPVELSSFTAVAHANEYVTLNWVTESESNLQGYNVYRSETENQDQSIRINANVINANNTTLTQNYSYTDREVENTTYYYWLEVSELSNENTFHGPIVVTVEDDAVVPGITETTFRNFGPSPFTSSTSTSLRVKEGETASVTIYNLLGQVVSRESFNAGEHSYTFNGKDLNNKTVANGIYFVRMTSPTQSKSFKIVKIK